MGVSTVRSSGKPGRSCRLPQHLFLTLAQVIHVEIAEANVYRKRQALTLASSQFSCISTASARTSLRQLSGLGKILTTCVRRLIS